MRRNISIKWRHNCILGAQAGKTWIVKSSLGKPGKTRIPFIQGCFVQSFFEIGPVALDTKVRKFCEYFRYFVFISPGKRAWVLIWISLDSLQPRMLCAMFGWNWISGSGEGDVNIQNLRRKRRTPDKVLPKSSLEPSVQAGSNSNEHFILTKFWNCSLISIQVSFLNFVFWIDIFYLQTDPHRIPSNVHLENGSSLDQPKYVFATYV